MNALADAPGPMQELPRDDIEAFKQRCYERTGSWTLTEKCLAAYLLGRRKADESWRHRRTA